MTHQNNQAFIDGNNLYLGAISQGIIISSDGDFTCLIKYLLEKNKLLKLITPTRFYSSLFRSFTKHILPLKQFATKVSA